MQLTSRAIRALLALVLSAGFGAGALAQPASAADSSFTATYRFTSSHLYLGQPAILNESDSPSESPVYPIMRFLNWGDRSVIKQYTLHAWPRDHVYVTPGRYRVGVHLKNFEGEGDGTFPDGNTVAVFPVPGYFKLDLTTATVRVKIANVPTDVRTVQVNWGDGKSTTAPRATRVLSHEFGKGTFEITAAVANANGLSAAKRVGTVKFSQRSEPVPTMKPPAPEAGDELPITGPGAAALAGTGSTLVLVGLAMLLVVRRRKLRSH